MARCLYTLPPTQEEAAAFGFTVDEATATAEVWPDNLHATNVFMAMSTQWHRIGMQGIAVGLIYSALPEVWERMGVPVSERNEVFSDLRVMEDAALRLMNEQAAKAAAKNKG